MTNDAATNEIDHPTLRAVLDTSVLMSEHRHWLWSHARDGHFSGIWSTFIVAELVRVRVRLSIEHGVATAVYRQRITNLVHHLSDVLAVAPYRDVTLSGALIDADDEPVLATALAGSASLIVSLNVKHFPPDGTMMGVFFLTPDAFLALLAKEHPAADLPRLAGEVGRELP